MTNWDKIMDQAAFDSILNAPAPVVNKWTNPMFKVQVMDKLPASIRKEAVSRFGEDGTQLNFTQGDLQDLRWYVMMFAGEIISFSGLGEATRDKKFHIRGKYTIPEFRKHNMQNVLDQEALKYARTQTHRIQHLAAKSKHLHRVEGWKKRGGVYTPGWEHPTLTEKDNNYYYYHVAADINTFEDFPVRDVKWEFLGEIKKD